MMPSRCGIPMTCHLAVSRSGADPVRAAAVARGDVRLTLDRRPEQLPEQVQLGLAGGGVLGRDSVDGAVALDQADDAVGADDRFGEVALLVLDDGQLAGSIEQRGVRPGACRRGDGGADRGSAGAVPRRLRRSGARRQASGSRPAGHWPARRSWSGRGPAAAGRDVVHVAWPAHAMADRLARDEPGGLQRVELLQDARSETARGRRPTARASSGRRGGGAAGWPDAGRTWQRRRDAADRLGRTAIRA